MVKNKYVFLINHSISAIREHLPLSDSGSQFLQMIESMNGADKTDDALIRMREQVIAIRDTIHPDKSFQDKINSLLSLCETMETISAEYHPVGTAALAQFIYENVDLIFKIEIENGIIEARQSENQKEEDMNNNLKNIHNMMYKFKMLHNIDPIQLTHFNKLLLLTIQAKYDPTQISHLKNEIKNHKFSISEKLYKAFFKPIYKTLNKFIMEAYFKLLPINPYSKKPTPLKRHKATFTLKTSGANLFTKKQKLYTNVSRYVNNLEEKNKKSSKK